MKIVLVKEELENLANLFCGLIRKYYVQRTTLNIFKINEFDATLISAYNAILHLNRALIFSKGFSVKGHLCIIKTIEELFKDNNEIIEFISSIERALESRNLV